MKTLRCKSCGSTDIRSIGNDMYQCQHCNTIQTEDKIIVELRGTVSTDGEETLKRGLEIAKAHQKAGDFEKANEVYQQLSEKFPERFELWNEWFSAIGTYMEITHVPVLQGYSFFDPKYVLEHAVTWAPDKVKPLFMSDYDKMYKEVADSIIHYEATAVKTDQFKCAEPFLISLGGLAEHPDVMRFRFNDFCRACRSTSDQLIPLIDAGIRNAEIMMKKGMYVCTPEDRKYHISWLAPQTFPDHYYPVFALGNMLVFSNLPASYNENRYFWILEDWSYIQDKKDHWDYWESTANMEWNAVIRRQCPYCGSTDVKTGFTGKRKCHSCRKEIHPKG